MSRIGRKPIPIPNGVEVKLVGSQIQVKGKLGSLKHEIPEKIGVRIEDKELHVERSGDDRFQRALHGLTRSLIANMVKGVSEGFQRTLILDGVGYKAAAKGDVLTLTVGYSHPIEYKMPEGISLKVERNKITVSGIDKQAIGQTAANIRSFKKVEPYKGKGLRYDDEVVRRKVGKVGT